MAGASNILYFTIITGLLTVVIATDYCNLKMCTQWGLVHTMCMYSSPAPASACQDWSDEGLTPAEKDAVVQIHNEMRRRVASGEETRGSNGGQPAAVNMPDLTWDDELELIAQRWASQCQPGHDSCRNVERYQVGQNMAMTMGMGDVGGDDVSAVKGMVQMWYDEVDLFDRNQVSRLTTIQNVGHYTQIISAVTETIGCGRIKYMNGGWQTHYFICNYGPSGNMMGDKIYEIK